MSEENYTDSSARRRRVQRLKKIIIFTLMILILIPFVLCIFLFFKIHDLNQKLDDMTEQIENLAQISKEQQVMAQQDFMENSTVGQGVASVGKAEPGVSNMGSLTDMEAVVTEDIAKNQLHKVYLTFDDGPSKYTEDILAILDRYQVRATFFVVGKEGEMAEEAMQAIVAGGHTLGLHSYSHKYHEIYQSVEAFGEDFTRLQDYVYEVVGVKSTVYRFPGGSSNTVSDVNMQEFADYLEGLGVEYYDWNISSGDGSSQQLTVQDIVKNCTKDIELYETSIILMHDSADKPTTVEALPIIIENILAMEDTVILPITEATKPVQHIDMNSKE